MRFKTLLIIAFFTAIIPLIVGSLIFWIWYFLPIRNLEFAGFITTLISIPVCLVGLLLVIIYKVKNKTGLAQRKKANRVIGLILLNIPMCVFYFWFATYLSDTERLTITNSSNEDLTDVQIFGTGDFHVIDRIEQRDCKTVWVHLNKEGAIYMLYNQNEKVKGRILEGYEGRGMGRIHDHKIFPRE